jgi:[ribosomal protein S5]-alanine N-acetyltransferase
MVETDRLTIKPLSYNQLVKYLINDNSLETELGLEKSSRFISGELKEALERTILPNVAKKPGNYLFSTLWTIISKEMNKMVGDLCFYGEPGSNGEIEVGYGIYEEFRKQGFIMEALAGMIKWAENQPKVSAIIASTEKSNVASFAVLQKNNFTKIGETETLFRWRLTVNKHCDFNHEHYR